MKNTPCQPSPIADLNGATVFTTLDVTSSYHQLELHPERRHITTFTTHVSLRRYKRLIFGINAASEIFQNEIAKLLVGLPDCKNISDDIIVYGRDEKEHDENLRRVLTRLEVNNAKLNREKMFLSPTPSGILWPHIQLKWSPSRPEKDRNH